ncbi:hypothetical protein EXU57_09285 [Segetibacter sp. 3557_3]|uniref:serine hydrolase domain-containing protein n=1 Tax=Segetibacter sp. 3557_3 TaxID=2547429 RepID=UPI001058CF3B|nr:serine hydrolase domain-containing protein [Segetibacter sp. 3557_3]TDH26986.1 hypothetical protein EXU57_09285 [Segetibacter sp. 3557_3]
MEVRYQKAIAGTRNMKQDILLKLAYFVLSFSLVAHALAQDKTTEVDKMFGWAKRSTAGCACAVAQNGKVLVSRAYGSADIERNVPITNQSVFDIGSTRKQFIAAAVLLLVEEKRLSLTEDIHKYLPELPAYGHRITIDHLLTHTSGIRDWTGILPLANGDPDALSLILRQRGLNFIPGEEWAYSNSGYVLLVEIVARTSAMSFADFVHKRLFAPLGMKSTTYVTDMTQVVPNRVLAYDRVGDLWKIDMYMGNDRGGGAILSTATDLLTWNDALLTKRLGGFVTSKLQEPAKLKNGRKLGYARGLFLETYRGIHEVAHSGGAAGYHSWLGSYPSQRLSIAVLCNSGSMEATQLARRIADQFLQGAGSREPEAGPPPTLTGDTLAEANGKTGVFFNERTGEQIRLAVDRGRFRVANGPGLVALTKNRFRRWGAFVQFMSQDAFEITFISPDEFELKSMEGKTNRYRRARPYAPTTEELKGFSGRYHSDELNAFFDISPGKESLVGRLNGKGPGLEVKPIDRDAFQLAGVIARFVRDKAGKVVALNYSNPLAKNIRFTRLTNANNR